jgi:hypothetical protein
MNFKLILPKGLTPEANVFVSVSSFTGYEQCLRKICQPVPDNPVCFDQNFLSSDAFTYTSFKKYTGTNDININCLDKNYKYKIKVSIIDNVGIIDNITWFTNYNTLIIEYPDMKILVKTLSVNNKTNKTIYLTDMVQINSSIEIEIQCPDNETLSYVDPISEVTFMNDYIAYFKAQFELLLALNTLNLQPLRST